jgi:tetratricopeptide (TPR) repeat protein
MQREYDLRPDLIFFTGDAAFGDLGRDKGLSIAEQFEEAIAFFTQVRQTFSPEIPAENFFIVPGNHDVNRNEVPSSTTAWLDSLLQKPREESIRTIQDMLHKANKDWQTCMERLCEYGLFLAVGFDHLLEDDKRLIYGIVRQVRDVKVGIAGLNCVWSSARDNERGRLWLGGHWQIQTLQQKITEAHVKIALMHQPTSWFVEVEAPALNPEIERTFHFLLHGHDHQNWVTPHGEQHVQIAAGACYGSSDVESGYDFVRLNLDEGTGEVWLRRYDELGGGWIPRVIHGKTDDRGVWPLKNLPCRLTPAPSLPSPKAIVTAEPPSEPPTVDSPESRGVFGRRADIDKAAQAFKNKPIVIFYGMSGIGKSQLIQEMRQHEVCRPLGYFRFNTYPNLKLDDLYRHLAPALGCAEENPALPVRVFNQPDFSALGGFVRNASPCIIHLDRAHHLFGEHGFYDPDIRDLLLSIIQYAPRTRLVLESREAPPQNLLPPDLCKVIRVNGLDRESVQAFFQHPFRDEPTKGWVLSDEEADIVYRRLGGNEKQGRAHPLGMVLLAQVAGGLEDTPAQILKRHEREFAGKLEEALFADLYNRVLKESERRVLRLCALYRDTIPDFHVDRLNMLAGDPSAFNHLVRRCLLTPDKGQTLYYLHSIIADLTQRHIDPSSDESFENHECIAEAWLSLLKISQHPSLPNIMAASEAVYHLIAAECFDRLDEVPGQLMCQGDIISYLERISRQLFQANRHKENRRVLELLTAIEPQNHKAHRFLGETIERLEGEGDEEALKHYEKAYSLNPHFPPYLASLGTAS